MSILNQPTPRSDKGVQTSGPVIMGDRISLPMALWALARSIVANRFIVTSMVGRAIRDRYQRTVLGILWAFLSPLMLLLIYSLVFGLVFKVRFPPPEASTAPEAAAGAEAAAAAVLASPDLPYGLVLFSGLLMHMMISEVLQTAPSIVMENRSYVTKVIFPLEVLPVTVLATAVFQGLVSCVVLLVAEVVMVGSLPWTTVLFPIVWLPFIAMCLGICLIVASLGVFLRDIEQIVGFLSTVLLFGSPILFPAELMPEFMQTVMAFNPLTVVVTAFRDTVLWGTMPNWADLGAYAGVSLAVLWFGAWWFARTRKGFADVL